VFGLVLKDVDALLILLNRFIMFVYDRRFGNVQKLWIGLENVE
jgi:hypothetical protein